MSKKQASVRVPDADLLAECCELLERQIGQKLPQATVVSAALIALRNQHVHELITKEDCRAWALKATVIIGAEIIQLLMDNGLCELGQYDVIPHPERGVEVRKDGAALTNPNKDEKSEQRPGWAAVN